MNPGLYNMEATFFSIIIPTFNSEKTLKSCLNSIVEQTFNNYEIILIDGLSKDSTINIIKAYLLKYPNIRWVSEADHGIYDAMNKGIKIATGEWIYFLGSDDRFHDNYVLQEVYSLNKSGFDVVYGNAMIVGDTSWAKDGDLYDGEFDLQKLFKKNICHQAIFYSSACFSGKIFFNQNYKLCSDWDFNLRCWANKPFLYINLIIVDFYGGGESTQYHFEENFAKDFDKNLLEYFGPKIFNEYMRASNPSRSLDKSFKKVIKKWVKQFIPF